MCLEAKQVLGWWTPDPLVLSTVATATAVYSRGLSRLWRSAGVGAGISRGRAAAYYLGQLSLLVALVSPIDRLSDILFSAHMTQHEILLVIAPPLVVLGRPLSALAWALPASSRVGLLRTLEAPRWTSLGRGAGMPLLILLLHGLVLWLWHIPSWFEAALRNEAIHALQHASFFGTAALFWWAVVSGRYGRAGYGLASAFVFATAMHTSVLGALLTVASRLWYPLYAQRAAAWDVNALADQQLAGLIMWVPAGVLMSLLSLALFAAWLGEAERRANHATWKRARAVSKN